MLSGIASYFLSAEPAPETKDVDYRTKEAEDDWLLVELAETSEAKTPEAEPASPPAVHPVGATAAPNPLEVTPPASPCPMDGSWYVTPPPCFTARTPVYLETSPLENLLIEHPSMSVYGPPPRLPPRQTETPPPSSSNSSRSGSPPPATTTTTLPPSGQTTEVLTSRRATLPRPSAVAARAGWIEQIQSLRPAQRAQMKSEHSHYTRSQMERTNRTRHVQATARHPRRKDRMMRHSGANNNRKC